MNTSTGVPLTWLDDATGYQCPRCGLFVCVPRNTWATCTRCAPIPVDETAAILLDEAQIGLDEGEITDVVAALSVLLNATAAPLDEAKS